MLPFALRVVVPSVLAAVAIGGCDDHSSREDETTSEVTLRVRTASRGRELPAARYQPAPELPAGDARPAAGQDSPSPRGQCDPNYHPCVPIDSDVDCAGGSGNGPSYVRGPVRVVGSDIYRLDRDGDGAGCDH